VLLRSVPLRARAEPRAAMAPPVVSRRMVHRSWDVAAALRRAGQTASAALALLRVSQLADERRARSVGERSAILFLPSPLRDRTVVAGTPAGEAHRSPEADRQAAPDVAPRRWAAPRTLESAGRAPRQVPSERFLSASEVSEASERPPQRR
jgi:hypothetical protein